ncbi:MAG: uracil-DNA glycosylase [Telluria sp.]
MTDQRAAAFLREMGIGPLWMLRGAAEARAEDAAEPAQAVTGTPGEAPQAHAAPPGQPAAPARAPAGDAAWDDAGTPAAEPDLSPEAIARMDWRELRAAVAACRRCGACREGVKPVMGTGAQQGAAWFVAAGASSTQDEKERAPVAGEAGKLLANMLRAAAIDRAEQAYVTNLVKCRPSTSSGGDRAPTAEEAAACRPFLERELALTGARLVLTVGQIAANGLLARPLPEPLSAVRGQVHQFGELPLVPTLHPAELLRRGQDKALAWADLCLAKSIHGGGR